MPINLPLLSPSPHVFEIPTFMICVEIGEWAWGRLIIPVPVSALDRSGHLLAGYMEILKIGRGGRGGGKE